VSSTLSPGSSGPLRLYLTARFTAVTALTMLRAAIVWQVFAVSQSAFHLGLIGIVQFLPALGLSLVGGSVADSHDRRRVMITAEVAPLCCALLLWAVTSREPAGLWLLYTVIFVISVAATFDNPAGAAMLPGLVARDRFPRAVATTSTTRALAFATGPAAAGFVIAEAGVGAVYAASATLVLVSLVALARLRAPAQESVRRVDWRGIREGVSFVRSHPVVLGCMTLDMLAVIFGGAAALLPIYATDGRVHYGAIAGRMTPVIVTLQALGVPFVGWIHDRTGGYQTAFGLVLLTTVIAAACISGTRGSPARVAREAG